MINYSNGTQKSGEQCFYVYQLLINVIIKDTNECGHKAELERAPSRAAVWSLLGVCYSPGSFYQSRTSEPLLGLSRGSVAQATLGVGDELNRFSLWG